MNKKIRNIILITYVLALILMISGATFAYFSVLQVAKMSADIELKSATTSLLTFSISKDININATNFNFQYGMGDLESNAIAQAYMKASESDLLEEYYYRFYLDILENTFEYSGKSKSPELLLTIFDPNGNEVTKINGLDYVTVDGISGFDITTTKGRIDIENNYPISTDSEVTQEWKVKVVFVNLNESQDLNDGKVLKGNLTIEKAD